jgi:hypothetical protein
MNVALLRSNSQQSRAYKPRQAHGQEVFSANFEVHGGDSFRNKDHKKYAKQESNEFCHHQEL